MMAKAVLEGLTFELRTNLDLLREVGIELGELRAVGGGARSDLWLQLKADICNISLRVPQVTEAACLGAALLAGTAAGVYPDLPTAVAQTVRVPTLIQPDPVASSDYEQRYALYLEIYPALRDLQTRL
jgi:xylulokinase